MVAKISLFVLLACIVASAVCNPIKYRSDSNERDDAKYQYAWQVKAGGPAVKSGYGAGRDSSEEGYAKGGARYAEFGQNETRNGKRTDGKYSVQLPDGRLQTVEYYVDGKSGYVAKVSYSGGSGERPAYSKKY